MKNVSRILWGVILVLLGLIIGLNSLGYTNIDVFFNGWWTLFIIVPSFIGLFNDNDKTGNIIGLLIGTILLLACQEIISFANIWKLLLPIILVIIGISIIFKDSINNKVRKEICKISKNNDGKTYCSTFSNQKIEYDDEEFIGCNLEAIFGGIECDLRDAIIKKDVVINTSCIFGGIDILLPKDIKVKVASTPIFGRVSNKHSNNKNDKYVTIYINSSCVFGGVEIK